MKSNVVVFKTICDFKYMDKDMLHNEIIKYGFIEYIGKSRIDGNYMYKIVRHNISTSRLYKINNIRKRMGKKPIYDSQPIELANTKDYDKFFDLYGNYTHLITLLEDHMPNFYLNVYATKQYKHECI